jgi:hypothetical protein
MKASTVAERGTASHRHFVLCSEDVGKRDFPARTGLVPFDPDKALSQLYVRMQTPSPPRIPTQAPRPWDPETPHNIAELQLQTKAVQELIRYCTQSPPTPAIQAVNQLCMESRSLQLRIGNYGPQMRRYGRRGQRE